jgi:hypothetical protein
VYLGLHSSEVEAARVYDRALVLLTGASAATNFPTSNYTKEMEAYQRWVAHNNYVLTSLLGTACMHANCVGDMADTMWMDRRIDNGEQLPGFHDDGEYSEKAFESWLRDAAITPSSVSPMRCHQVS